MRIQGNATIRATLASGTTVVLDLAIEADGGNSVTEASARAAASAVVDEVADALTAAGASVRSEIHRIRPIIDPPAPRIRPPRAP